MPKKFFNYLFGHTNDQATAKLWELKARLKIQRWNVYYEGQERKGTLLKRLIHPERYPSNEYAHVWTATRCHGATKQFKIVYTRLGDRTYLHIQHEINGKLVIAQLSALPYAQEHLRDWQYAHVIC